MLFLRRHRRQREPGELDITAFMNLMVVLVPFLLTTAVYSRLAVLEMNLPSPSTESSDAEEARLNLELVLRARGLEVADRGRGLIRRFEEDGQGNLDLAAVSALLAEIKARHPEVRDATVLLEPEVRYQRLVDVMDTLRVAHADGAPAELFPEIAIGDAPVRGGGAR